MLAIQGHFLTIAITLTTLFVVPFLTPIKNGLVSVVEDSTGWDVLVSFRAAVTVAVVYGAMTICTFFLIIRTWPSHTGLKWDPSPLACQLSLIQGSNVAEAFRDFEYKYHKDLVKDLRQLSDKYGILRLGYWRATDNDTDIFYGIRFMKLGRGKSTPNCSTGLTNLLLDNKLVSSKSISGDLQPFSGDLEHINHERARSCRSSSYHDGGN